MSSNNNSQGNPAEEEGHKKHGEDDDENIVGCGEKKQQEEALLSPPPTVTAITSIFHCDDLLESIVTYLQCGNSLRCWQLVCRRWWKIFWSTPLSLSGGGGGGGSLRPPSSLGVVATLGEHRLTIVKQQQPGNDDDHTSLARIKALVDQLQVAETQREEQLKSCKKSILASSCLSEEKSKLLLQFFDLIDQQMELRNPNSVRSMSLIQFPVTVNPRAMPELKCFRSPPLLVRLVCEAVLYTLGKPAFNWDAFKKESADPVAFLDQLAQPSIDLHTHPDREKFRIRIKNLQEQYLSDPSFNRSKMAMASSVGAGLFDWLMLMVKFGNKMSVCDDVIDAMIMDGSCNCGALLLLKTDDGAPEEEDVSATTTTTSTTTITTATTSATGTLNDDDPNLVALVKTCGSLYRTLEGIWDLEHRAMKTLTSIMTENKKVVKPAAPASSSATTTTTSSFTQKQPPPPGKSTKSLVKPATSTPPSSKHSTTHKPASSASTGHKKPVGAGINTKSLPPPPKITKK